MSWSDRIAPFITLTSPSGLSFQALWRGDSTSLEKRVGQHDYPKIDGTATQDMGVKGGRWPLTFYFDDIDHDVTAAEFLIACKDRGPWRIDHPVYGIMDLQLINVTTDVDPTESAGITKVTSDWIEPMNNGVTLSVPQLSAIIQDQIETVLQSSASQFRNVVDMESTGGMVSLTSSVSTVVGRIQNVINITKQTISTVVAKISSVRRGILGTIGATAINIFSLAGQIQALISLPGLMAGDISSRFNFYAKVLSDIAYLTPSKPTTAGRNHLAIQELIATSCLTGMVQAVIDNALSTRQDAISYMDTLSGTLRDVTALLDKGQAVYAAIAIDRQYFSQSQAYNDLAILVGQTTDYLIQRSYDLAVAKRFTLAAKRSPIEIAITEGVDLDMFIATNNLKGNDILLLPAGRQVVVYL